MSSIPEVPLERRLEILSLRGGTAVHAALLAELGFDSALELVGPIAPAADRGEALRVVAWNAQRCRDPEAAAALLRRTGAQPVDQAFLLRPVRAALIKDRRAVAGGFGEGAVAGLGDDGVGGTQQVGE